VNRWNRIRAAVEHRPFPPPERGHVMYQTWHDLLFAHWEMRAAVLAPLVPRPLALDTRDGRAFVAIVPFRMSGVRPRFVPPVPGLSAFCELNVRTYVVHGGAPGVLFLSLEAANGIAVALARRWFRLPYFRASMSLARDGDALEYRSVRRHRGAPPAELDARYRPIGPDDSAAPGTLEHWLCERYCLYTLAPDGAVLRVDVHHPPWRLAPAELVVRRNTMARAHGLELPDAEPWLHFSRRQDVLVWWPRRDDAG
jgi:hypothetical protein